MGEPDPFPRGELMGTPSNLTPSALKLLDCRTDLAFFLDYFAKNLEYCI